MTRAAVESVFYGSAIDSAKGFLLSLGVEGVHILLAGADESVSMEAIRKVYKEQGWEENASLDLEQFTSLWTATIADGDDMSSQNREDSDVSHTLVKDCANAAVSRAKAVFLGVLTVVRKTRYLLQG